MKLTTYTDYSLRVLMYLGIHRDEAVTMSQISESFGISHSHIMKVVHELGQLGYLHTTRGKNGGIQLGRKPEDINLGALVRDTEKNLELVECMGPNNQCKITPACELKPIVSKALGAFLAVLDEYTLVDLIKPEKELKASLIS